MWGGRIWSRGSHTGSSHLEINEQKASCIKTLPGVYNFKWDLFAEDLCHGETQETDISSDSKFSAFIESFVKLVGAITNNGDLEGPSELICDVYDKFSASSSSLDNAKDKVESYESFQSCLTEFSEKLMGSEVFSASEEVSKQLQQHRLFVLALMSNAPTYNTLYKVQGTNTLQCMYKKIHLLGDSRLRGVFSKEFKGDQKPYVYVKDTVSLFTLREFLGEVFPPEKKLKGKNLIICSVGIRDVVRTIDEWGIYRTLETTIQEMKSIKKFFHEKRGSEHDFIFTDVLPVDLNSLLARSDEANSLSEEGSAAKMNQTTIKLIKFTYLLSKNMMVENLSRIRHLPTWEIFGTSLKYELKEGRITIPALGDGVNPDFAQYPLIHQRISNLCCAYNVLKDPPSYKKEKCTVHFICNEKYSAMQTYWPKMALDEKPEFLFLDSISSFSLVDQLKSNLQVKENSAVVIWFDILELFNYSIITDCTNHAPIKLVSPKILTCREFFDHLVDVRREIQEACGTSNVMFATLCPLDYKALLKLEISLHAKLQHQLQLLPDEVLTKLNTCLLEVTDLINMYIIQSNRVRGLPTWDLCSALYSRNEKTGSLTFTPHISPCNPGPVSPQTIAKIMMTVRNMTTDTIDALNWLNYIKNKQHTSNGHKTKKNWNHKEVPSKKIKGQNIRVPKMSKNNNSHFSACNDNSYNIQQPHSSSNLPYPTPRPSWDAPATPYTVPPFNSFHHPNPAPCGSIYQVPNRFPGPVWDRIAYPGSQCSSEANAPSTSGWVDDCKEDKSGWEGDYRDVRSSSSWKDNPEKGYPKVGNVSSSWQMVNISLAAKEKAQNLSNILGTNDDEPAAFMTSDWTLESHGSSETNSREEPNMPTSASQGNSINVESVIAGLLTAHETEMQEIRVDPEKHPNYSQQQAEFMEQAVKTCMESGEEPDVEAIGKMWQVYWKMQLEQSSIKIWEKRVNNLTQMLNESYDLSDEDKLKLSSLAEKVPSNTGACDPNKLSSSETSLLNRLKKKKTPGNSLLPREARDRNSGVILGEKMLSQVRKGWQNIGIRSSQKMLDSALSKLRVFMNSPDVQITDKVQYVDLIQKINSFKEYLVAKEANPYGLDFKSIAEITKTLSDAELAEYVIGVLKGKHINAPASEDVALICEAVKARQKKPKTGHGFVSAGKFRI